MVIGGDRLLSNHYGLIAASVYQTILATFHRFIFFRPLIIDLKALSFSATFSCKTQTNTNMEFIESRNKVKRYFCYNFSASVKKT